MKVSIIIALYNEEVTTQKVLTSVLSLPLEKEVIVVNDGSTDATAEKLLPFNKNITLITHEKNQGKGAAIKSALQKVTGEIVTIHDGDFEYDPQNIEALIAPIAKNETDIVYGSRFLEKKNNYRIHTYLANKLLTFLTRLFVTIPVTDMETCQKAFRASEIKKLTLLENRFGIEPEITIKLAKIVGIRYLEIPISYQGRSTMQGKKVRWYDGLRAIWCILKYGIFK